MERKLFFVEVGVLLGKDASEFESYNIKGFYEGKLGFYDENKLTFLTYEKAKEYADYYIKHGVETTYAIIYSFVCNIEDNELKEIKESAYCEWSLEPPEEDTVLYFAHKENGKLVDKINKGDK